MKKQILFLLLLTSIASMYATNYKAFTITQRYKKKIQIIDAITKYKHLSDAQARILSNMTAEEQNAIFRTANTNQNLTTKYIPTILEKFKANIAESNYTAYAVLEEWKLAAQKESEAFHRKLAAVLESNNSIIV